MPSGIAFLVYSVLAFVVLWLGARWPLRRALLISVLIGLVVDALTDLFVARLR